MKRIPNLTSLRFILAFLVVIFHVPQFCKNRGFPFFNDLPIFHRGEEAVYMFFSLSGFLIIRQLFLEKSKTHSVNLKHFFQRRVLRIFPLYYLVLTVGLVYYQLILPYFGFEYESNYNLIHGIFLGYTFFPNIFATYHPGGIIEILWSIGIEEQFYLFIAPLVFVLPLKRIVHFLLFFTVVYFTVYFSETMAFLKQFSMLFFYFSFSGACSILMLKKNTHFKKFRIPVFVVFVLYFTTSIFIDNLSELVYHLFSMLLFGATLSALAVKPIKFLENKQLNYLGKISYGVYMYHAILMQLVGYLYLKSNLYLEIPNLYAILLFNLLVLTATIAIADISYTYYEKYFLNLKKR